MTAFKSLFLTECHENKTKEYRRNNEGGRKQHKVIVGTRSKCNVLRQLSVGKRASNSRFVLQ